MHKIWRLNEASEHNLGLACSEQGLMLGRTRLIERCSGRFVVRERHEIARLLRKAYAAELPLDRLMHGLGNAAAALNANDQLSPEFGDNRRVCWSSGFHRWGDPRGCELTPWRQGAERPTAVT
jgi:hypothetical protein